MATKPSWDDPPPEGPSEISFGRRTADVVAVLDRVRSLDVEAIRRLDLAERADHGMLLLAWDHVRDRLRSEPFRTWRLGARSAAWRAAREAAERGGIAIGDQEGYWRVQPGAGYGSARIACYTACAPIAPELLEPEMLDIVLAPWRRQIRDPLRPAG